MNTPTNTAELAGFLRQMSAELDEAIGQAIENPLRFSDSSLIGRLEAQCLGLQPENLRFETDRSEKQAIEVGKLIWDVRARAGRLQRLMDSAAHFYSTCFSTQPVQRCADCLDYGMHGGWSAMAGSNHLAVDC